MGIADRETETLFLLDRNVISVIKDANAGKEQKGEKQHDMLEYLRSIDAPQYAVSPLLSLIEGEHGREDTYIEKSRQLRKETGELASFFDCVSTDSDVLSNLNDTFAHMFTGLREGNADARALFRKDASPLVIHPVARNRRGAIEAQLLELAASYFLQTTDAIVVLFLACLYGSAHARKVLKPSRPTETYNVLSDIHLIPWVGLIKAEASRASSHLNVQVLTLDGGLDQVINSIEFVNVVVLGDWDFRMDLRYLPSLFPDLSPNGAIELVLRLNDGAA